MKAHAYADKWRLLDGEAFEALCADIEGNGLREPIITFNGQIADGRNRYAACERVGVKPHFREFEGDEDGLLAFIESANAHRRHDSPGQVAASRALMWIEAGRRREGRWVGWSRTSQEIGKSSGEVESMRRAGVIADHAPDLLVSVRDDDLSLNAAHEKACDARDAEQKRKEREAAEAKEEADAEAFIKDKAPGLAERVDGDDLQTYAEALDLWERRNKEEAERIAKAKAAERRKEQERLDGIKRDANRVLNFLDGLAAAANLHRHPFRSEVLASLPPHHRTRILSIEKEATWPTTL